MGKTYKYVPDIFSQSAGTVSGVSQRFGLHSSITWEALSAILSPSPNSKVKSKLVYFARHGEGWHNVGEQKYGTAAWDLTWSKRNGDDEIEWGPDPELTSIGIRQAVDMNQTWKFELANSALLPQSFYCSPMSRTLQTLELTWNGIRTDAIVCEEIRELMNCHTCDKRRTRSFYQPQYPAHQWDITENDLLWSKNTVESAQQIEARIGTFLDLIFATEDRVISVTSHSGFIRMLLEYIGHPPCELATGKMIPVVIRAQSTF